MSLLIKILKQRRSSFYAECNTDSYLQSLNLIHLLSLNSDLITTEETIGKETSPASAESLSSAAESTWSARTAIYFSLVVFFVLSDLRWLQFMYNAMLHGLNILNHSAKIMIIC